MLDSKFLVQEPEELENNFADQANSDDDVADEAKESANEGQSEVA